MIIVGSEVRLLFQPVAFWILLVALLKHGHDYLPFTSHQEAPQDAMTFQR